MLIAGELSNSMRDFVMNVNKIPQEDAEKAINAYCNNLENIIYDAIKSLTITIPPGAIQVQGSSVAQTNLAPIVLEKVIK